MSYKKGVVQSIVMREAKEGKFGKFANYALKIDDVYYNSIASEHNGKIEIKDAAYALISEGTEVEFMFSVNDKGYNDIDKKTLKVIGGQPKSAPAPQAPVASPQPLQSNKIEASAIDAHIWTECLKSAVATLDAMAKNAPVDKPVEISHERVMKLADIYFNKAIS